MNIKRILYSPVTVALFSGFSGTALQIILIQESLAQNSGNELSVAILLGTWLLLTGLGSFTGCFIPLRKWFFTILPPVMACFIPVTLIFFRLSPLFFIKTTGELPGLINFFCIPLFTLAPFCLLNGLLFALPVRFIRATGGDHKSAAAVYAAEALGALSAAIYARTVYLFSTSTLQLAGCILAALTPLVLLARHAGGCTERRSFAGSFYIILLLLIPAFFLCFSGTDLSQQIDASLWPGQSLISVFDSLYGRWHLVEYDGEAVLFNNNLPASQSTITRIDEETIALSLALHANPVRILLLEGVFNKMESITRQLDESDIHVVALDTAPFTHPLQSQYSRILGCSPRNFPGHLHRGDPRMYLETVPRNSFDIIISNASPPGSLSSSRFYSMEFFSQVRKALHPDGIFAMTVAGSENVMSREQSRYINVILNALFHSFSRDTTLMLPGDVIHLFAGVHEPQSLRSEDILDRLEQMEIQTLYPLEGYLPYRLHPLLSQPFRDALDAANTGDMSTDTKPLVFPAYLDLWHSQWRPGRFKPFSLEEQGVSVIAISCLIGIMLLHLAVRSGLCRICIAVCLTGSISMVTQIMLLFLLQLRTGALYREACILLGVFASGLAMGSAVFSVFFRHERHMLPAIQLCLAGFLLLLGLYTCSAGVPSVVLIVSGALLCGLLGGAQFVLASRRYPDSMPVLYSMDLAGGAVTALFVSTLFLPVAGIPFTALVFGCALAISGGFLFRRYD
jgi:hypothetical protein